MLEFFIAHQVGIIILTAVLLVSLLCYIIARIRLSKEKLVLTSSSLDVTFVMVSPLLAIIGFLLDRLIPSFGTAALIVWVIAIICFALSIMFSIISNKESVWNMIWSVGAKVFIFITTIFIIIFSIIAILGYLIYYLVKEHSKDEEDGEGKRVTLPQYRKFMNAYVGRSEKKK